MADFVNSRVGCLLVGEYVDEADCPTTPVSRQGEVVRPQVAAEFLDIGKHTDGLREFTVLLKDGRVAAVRGHSLKQGPHPVAGQEVYSIVVRNSGEEELIALFNSAEVAGIFHGDLRTDRRIA